MPRTKSLITSDSPNHTPITEILSEEEEVQAKWLKIISRISTIIICSSSIFINWCCYFYSDIYLFGDMKSSVIFLSGMVFAVIIKFYLNLNVKYDVLDKKWRITMIKFLIAALVMIFIMSNIYINIYNGTRRLSKLNLSVPDFVKKPITTVKHLMSKVDWEDNDPIENALKRHVANNFMGG